MVGEHPGRIGVAVDMRGTYLICSLAMVLQLGCGGSGGSDEGANPVAVPAPVRAALIEMGDEDQAVREGLSPETMQDIPFLQAMLRGDSARSNRLRAIVATYGWPTPTTAGPEAANAAFLILQHSPDHEFQSSLLPELEAAGAGRRHGALGRGHAGRPGPHA